MCKDMLNLISKHLMPRASSNPERMVTYYKLEGDYYRYVAEVGEGDRL